MSKEDTEIELVKDFLKMRGYKNALDGLEKDDYKTIEKKKVNHYQLIIYFYRIFLRKNNQNLQSCYKKTKTGIKSILNFKKRTNN
jgi:hypothetical protein